MERLARPKDDLFESSTMTFGEHLEELRQCLVKAIICLTIGLAIGLCFASSVIRYIQSPLEAAIREYHADRDLTKLGYGDKLQSDEIKPLRNFLKSNGLIWELIYEIPEELQSIAMDDVRSAKVADQSDQAVSDADSPKSGKPEAVNIVKPVAIAELLQSLPDPQSLKPKIQLRQSEDTLSSFKMEEGFMIWVKAGLIVGAVIASPGIFYYIWSFVAAGLHVHERRYVYIYLPFSVVLFTLGVVLAFFVVLHYVLTFLLAFNGSMDVAVEPRLTYYVNFVLLLPLGFGIAFQLPLVMLFLQRIGLFETQAYIESWKVAVLVILVASMLLTPADVSSMIALAIPLIFLYGLGIVMCHFLPRGRGLGSAAYDPS